MAVAAGDPPDADHLRYEGVLSATSAGRYGFTVRVVPHHPDLATPAELGLAAWAVVTAEREASDRSVSGR